MCNNCKMINGNKCSKYNTVLNYDETNGCYKKCNECLAYIVEFARAVMPQLKKGKRRFTPEERIEIFGRAK